MGNSIDLRKLVLFLISIYISHRCIFFLLLGKATKVKSKYCTLLQTWFILIASNIYTNKFYLYGTNTNININYGNQKTTVSEKNKISNLSFFLFWSKATKRAKYQITLLQTRFMLVASNIYSNKFYLYGTNTNINITYGNQKQNE